METQKQTLLGPIATKLNEVPRGISSDADVGSASSADDSKPEYSNPCGRLRSEFNSVGYYCERRFRAH